MIRYATDKPVYNWAKSGLGNVGIFCRLIECDLKFKFTKRDAIIIQWTNWTREDRYIQGWKAHGNVFNNPYYDYKYLKKYWSYENDIIKNSTAIIAANKAYRIKYQFNMLDYLTKESGHEPEIDSASVELSKFYLKHLPVLDSWPADENTFFGDTCIDPHPDIKNHLYFFNNYIKPRFSLELGDKENMLLEMSDAISQQLNKSMTYPETHDRINKVVHQYDPNFYFKDEGF